MELAKGVHLLESTKGSYVYLVLDENGPVLIDTGMRGRYASMVEELRRIGLEISDIAHVLLTHSDVDHIGNAKQIREQSGAFLWAPKDDLPYIHRTRRPKGLRRVIGAMMKADAPEIDGTYQPGQRIGTIEMIPTPGHTPGHVSFRYGDMLFAGDLVTSRRGTLRPSPGFLTEDKGKLRQSLAEVGKLSFDYVCPAHGEPVRRGNLWASLVGP